MGSDGSLILCTVAGHVYIRTLAWKGSRQQTSATFGPPNAQPNKLFRFQRVPYLQRVVQVCANGIGSFAALRQEAKPSFITVSGAILPEDMSRIRPFVLHYLYRGLHIDDVAITARLEEKAALGSGYVEDVGLGSDDNEDDDPAGLVVIEESIKTLAQLLDVLSASQHVENRPPQDELLRAHGADTVVRCVVDIPVHRVILVLRCPALACVLQGTPLEDMVNDIHVHAEVSAQRVNFAGVHPLTVLVLLHYLYTDILPTFWNPVVIKVTAPLLSASHVIPSIIKSQLQTLARLLHLTSLVEALHSVSPSSPKPTLSSDMAALFTNAQENLLVQMGGFTCPSMHDIVVELADKRVACHSAILRARSPFFSAFLGDEDWTCGRWKDGILEVNLKHMEWKPMSFVFRFMYQDVETDMFDAIGESLAYYDCFQLTISLPSDFTDTLDDFLDFVFSVMACAVSIIISMCFVSRSQSASVERAFTRSTCISLLLDNSPTRLHQQRHIASRRSRLLSRHATR